MIVIVSGTIGRSVTGGQAWANLHYLLGLRALGHDVYYLEDVGDWSETYDWQTQGNTNSLDYPSTFIHDVLSRFDLGEKWIYRTTTESRGIDRKSWRGLYGEADLLLIRGVPMMSWREEYNLPSHRAFIDVDPGFTQLRLANYEPPLVETIDRCDSLFTFATQIDHVGCSIPKAGRNWRPTVPPIDRTAWSVSPTADDVPFSTIARWRGVHDVELNGVRLGQRDQEFPKFFALPQLTGERFRIALLGEGRDALRSHGWEVVDGGEATITLDLYRQFITESRGEFGVAKQCYVETRGGWISDRSVSYLAAGRPVIVQDTGVGDEFREGEGLLTFSTIAEAADAVRRVQGDYETHAAQASRLASEFFDAKRVLSELIATAGD